MDIDMSCLEIGLKDTVLTQCVKFTTSTISTPKSYDEHPRQVKYGSPPPWAKRTDWNATNLQLCLKMLTST